MGCVGSKGTAVSETKSSADPDSTEVLARETHCETKYMALLSHYQLFF